MQISSEIGKFHLQDDQIAEGCLVEAKFSAFEPMCDNLWRTLIQSIIATKLWQLIENEAVIPSSVANFGTSE